jgi:predicted dehydrogenase
VVICTPNNLHSKETVQAAYAGKHILIEKPVATTLEGLREMRDAVRRSGVKTIVSFPTRWTPKFIEVKNLVHKGIVGDTFYVETAWQSFLGEETWKGWSWGRTLEASGGAFLSEGIHAMDVARCLATRELDQTVDIVEVTAYSGGWRLGSEMDYPGFGVSLVRFANGVVGRVTVNMDTPMPYTFQYGVFGNEGVIRDDVFWSKKLGRGSDWTPIAAPKTSFATEVDMNLPFRGLVDHFVECITDDREAVCSLEKSVNTHEACFAAGIAAQESRRVRLPLLPG